MRCLRVPALILCAVVAVSAAGRSLAAKTPPMVPRGIPVSAQAQRADRLLSLADVCVDWHCRIAAADGEQRKKLAAELAHIARKLANQKSWRQVDFEPELFTGSRGGAGRVLTDGRPWKPSPSGWQVAVRKILTADQFTVLQRSLAERQAFLISNSTKAHLAYLEQLAGLSKSERKLLGEHLTKEFGEQLIAQPLCIENLVDLRLLDDAKIRNTLRDRAAMLRRVLDGGKKNGNVTLSASITIKEDWTEEERSIAISESIGRARASLARQQSSFVRLIVNRYELSKEQARRLETAAKGARARHARKWSDQLARNVERQENTQIVGVNGVTLRTSLVAAPLTSNVLWTRTLQSVLQRADKEVVRTESEFVRSGIVSQLVVAFDHELWLRPDQREPFRKCVDAALRTSKPSMSRKLQSELFRRIAKSLPDQKVAAILTRAQLRVLKNLRQ